VLSPCTVIRDFSIGDITLNIRKEKPRTLEETPELPLKREQTLLPRRRRKRRKRRRRRRRKRRRRRRRRRGRRRR
jgi:hypothetical protein